MNMHPNNDPSPDGQSESQELATKLETEAFALIGANATRFSAIEFLLQFTLSLLISGKTLAPEAVLSFRSQSFGQRIQLLRDLVGLRLSIDSKLREKGTALVSSLEALREKRNHFIHGFWIVNYHLIVTTGGVRCSDTKWRFDKETNSWVSLTTKDFPLTELQNQLDEISQVTTQMHELNSEIEELLKQGPKKKE